MQLNLEKTENNPSPFKRTDSPSLLRNLTHLLGLQEPPKWKALSSCTLKPGALPLKVWVPEAPGDRGSAQWIAPQILEGKARLKIQAPWVFQPLHPLIPGPGISEGSSPSFSTSWLWDIGLVV